MGCTPSAPKGRPSPALSNALGDPRANSRLEPCKGEIRGARSVPHVPPIKSDPVDPSESSRPRGVFPATRYTPPAYPHPRAHRESSPISPLQGLPKRVWPHNPGRYPGWARSLLWGSVRRRRRCPAKDGDTLSPRGDGRHHPALSPAGARRVRDNNLANSRPAVRDRRFRIIVARQS